MQSAIIQKISNSFQSPLRKVNGTGNLIDNLSKAIETDLLCLPKDQQEQILLRVGVSLADFQSEGLKAKSFSDVWSIELLIIEKLKFSDLVARLWLVRQKFRSQVGDDLYKHYLSTLPSNLTDEKLKETLDQGVGVPAQAVIEEAIRGDTINLTRQMQRLSYYKFLRLDSIYKVKGRILVVFIIVLLIMGWVLFLLYSEQSALKEIQPQYFSLGIITIFSGMIGSCMSLLQRTEKASTVASSFTDSVLEATDINLSMSILYICSLVLSGAIFSSILYLLAVSNFIDLGILFPKLTLLTGPGPVIPSYCLQPYGIHALFGCIEFEHKNALMLVWAFMAGFAERLVPDTLDSLMEKNRKPKT